MMDLKKVRLGKVPFHSWECITLQIGIRDINLVIKNEKRMDQFIKLLIHSLNTVDGNKDSAVKIKEALKSQFKSDHQITTGKKSIDAYSLK